MDDGGGVALQVLPDRLIGFPQKRRGLVGFDSRDVVCDRQWVPIQKITAASLSVERRLITPRIKQAKVFLELLTWARLRQAQAESQAWTPMLSPWTLPGGLPIDSSLGLRPRSRSTSWFAASEMASPTAAAEKPSANAAATASAACSGVDLKMVRLI